MGRILSTEEKSVILSFERSLGDFISEAFLYYDPWELLEQLILRLEEAKKSKKKTGANEKANESFYACKASELSKISLL